MTSTIQFISLYSMVAIYCVAGVTHFIKPKVYLSITPKWVPFPLIVNYIVGLFEFSLGIALLFSETRSYAAIGIMALLIAVFPANVYHYQKAKRKGKFIVPTLIRIPFQIVLIYWAYTFVVI